MEYYGEEIGTLVVEPGSSYFRCGYAGDSSPNIYIPSAVGVNLSTKKQFAGGKLDFELNKKEFCNLEVISPISSNKIIDWDSYETLFRETLLDDLKVNPKEHPLLITEAADCSAADREKTAQMAFESLGFDSFFLAKQPVLSCFAAGRSSGLVLDVGGEEVRCVPVFDGYTLPAEIQKSPLAGNWVDSFLQKRLASKGIRVVEDSAMAKSPSVFEYVEKRILRDIKENFCFVKSDETAIRADSKDYKLPDGRLIEISGEDRHLSTEAFFCANSDINKAGMKIPPKAKPIPQLIADTLLDVDADLRKTLVSNVVVSGKGFLLKGFYKRLFASVNTSLPPALNKLKIIMPSDNVRRNFEVAWIGGSILGSLSTFKQLLFTREEYEESGAALVREKCP